MVKRRGLTQIGFWDDPEVKKIIQMEALKAGIPMTTIIRKLLRDWLKERKVKFSTKMINEDGVHVI